MSGETYARIHLPLRRKRASVGAGVGFLDSSCVIRSPISALVSLDALNPRSVPYNESTSDLLRTSVSSTDSIASSAINRADPPSLVSGSNSSSASMTLTLKSARETANSPGENNGRRVSVLIGTRVVGLERGLGFAGLWTRVVQGNWLKN